MIQRILRGQWLYLLLAVLVMVIYVAGVPMETVTTDGEPTLPPIQFEEPLEWWPKEVDAVALREAVNEQPILGVLLSLLTVFMGGMMAGGLAFSWWSVLSGRVRSLWAFSGRRLPAWSFAELGRITALMIVAFSLLPLLRFAPPIRALGLSPGSLLWVPLSMLLLDGFLVLAIFAFASGKGIPIWKAVGLSPRRLPRALAGGFTGYLVIFPWLFLLLFLTVELIRFFHLKPPLEPIQVLLFQQHDPLVIGLLVALSCVIGPIAEELFFRGVLFPAVRQRFRRGTAILLSGAAFALIHTNPVGFLPIMLIGSLFAYLYERTGSLLAPIAVHIVHNTFLMSIGLVVRGLLLDA
jgi:membrane protease YdiL (CAAX protease family)